MSDTHTDAATPHIYRYKQLWLVLVGVFVFLGAATWAWWRHLGSMSLVVFGLVALMSALGYLAGRNFCVSLNEQALAFRFMFRNRIKLTS